ncbi:intraflagellar transport protein 70A-like [Saccoglossus kowalevskii]|uniref:Tetratricopeptide repeat protein 30 n=1 Tax=Saccoglossus kowalevskii TaxID=10224 RepID=A0ABM0GRF4_SACKO|nr:PREDICTED: tetratricopeptide repeat protein 30A-like [Saccoglossus kowalevskii]
MSSYDNISDGEYSSTVYTMIKEGKYTDAIQILSSEIQNHPRSRAALSLLGYCYFYMQDFVNAAECYEQLVQLHPENDDYKIYHAQSLYKACMYQEAMKATSQIENSSYEAKITKVQAAIRYGEEDLPAAKSLVEQCPSDDADTEVNMGCLLFKEGRYEQACHKFTTAMQILGYKPVLGILHKAVGSYFDLAADVLAENTHLTFKYMSQYLFDFIDAILTQQTAPEEAYRKLDDMASKHTEQLRKMTKQVQEARQNHDDEAVKKAVNDYDEALERYIPVLMSQAKIYWDMENYAQVEKIFRKSVEFCNEHDSWKLNVAHVLFMQETKFKEATGFYEPIVKKHYDNILSVSAIVLANLCVSYIMTSQNEEAEELMRKIEKEEEQVAYDDPDKKVFHLCIVNLVIGTLYCAKGNYEFGISRVIKSLEPYNKKLGTDTWFYAKRCFLSLLENMAKHMIMLRDSVIQECIQFLEHCEGR